MSGYYKKALGEEEGGYEGQARDDPDQSVLFSCMKMSQ